MVVNLCLMPPLRSRAQWPTCPSLHPIKSLRLLSFDKENMKPAVVEKLQPYLKGVPWQRPMQHSNTL
jgi:hypothetical protein